MVLRPSAAIIFSITGRTSMPARMKIGAPAASNACSVSDTMRGSWPATTRMFDVFLYVLHQLKRFGIGGVKDLLHLVGETVDGGSEFLDAIKNS